MRPTITILPVDDHAIVRKGCRLLLQQVGFEIAGEAFGYLSDRPR